MGRVIAMINTYLATSKEFQPIVVTKTVNGITTPVTSGVQYVVVPKGTPLEDGVLKNADTLEGQVGFFTDQLTKGYWEVGVKLSLNPEQPLIHCGYVRIR
jgi:hypothetical protein